MAVWQTVDQMLSRADVQSATAAADDVRPQTYRREPSRAAAAEKFAVGGPLPGQCGIVVSHGSWVQAMDLFGAPDLLAVHWPALIRSYLIGSPVVQGRPSPTRVLELMRRFSSAPGQQAPGVGSASNTASPTSDSSARPLPPTARSCTRRSSPENRGVDITFVTCRLTKHPIYDIMSGEWCNELPACAIHPLHQPACPMTLLSG